MYSIETVTTQLTEILRQYLEADYHIWDESLIRDRRKLLDGKNTISSEPRLEATPSYLSGKRFDQMQLPKSVIDLMVSAAKIKNAGVYLNPRKHQQSALEEFLGNGNEIVVTAGTGSGKTESFLYPILGSFALESERGNKIATAKGCRALLLYPMNALVNDQLTRLRKLFGNDELATLLEKIKGRKPTFGVYTSRTSYPGSRVEERDKDLIKKIEKLYVNDEALKSQKILWEEGLWPAKDMQEFIHAGLKTNTTDSELFTRHEMQESPPDILITNYSMLEYMLIRPVEMNIFSETSKWLNSHEENYLTVVLDEAHIYRGVSGTEVALLLRRLQSRLGVGREKLKFILTSASFAGDDEILKFAKNLTGKPDGSMPFKIIKSEQETKLREGKLTQKNIIALKRFEVTKIHQYVNNFEDAKKELDNLFNQLDLGSISSNTKTIEELRNICYEKISQFPPAALLSNTLTRKAISFDGIVDLLDGSNNADAVEKLIALCSFAQDAESSQVFLPVRLHLMYRGIPGLYVCLNKDCTENAEIENRLLGKIYTSPRIKCECGSRVLELLTHRDCGAAFIRGYVAEDSSLFVLHQQSLAVSDIKLKEAHFLVEPNRSHKKDVQINYIHKETGRLLTGTPTSPGYVTVKVSKDRSLDVNGKKIWSFHCCPVCNKLWDKGSTKIQDLATKGEAPFSYLVQKQVFLQPPSRQTNSKFPLSGRKTLIFSDGRQKAARLARDIPRSVEKDVFRSCLLLAAKYLEDILTTRYVSLNPQQLYIAFLFVLIEKNIVLFDGDYRKKLLIDLKNLRRRLVDIEIPNKKFNLINREDFRELAEDSWQITPAFEQLLLINLCSAYYSIYSLTLAILEPSSKPFKEFCVAVQNINLSEEDVYSICCNWFAAILEKNWAFGKIPVGTRKVASGNPFKGPTDWGVSLERNKKFFNRLKFIDSEKILILKEALLEIFCLNDGGFYFLNPFKVTLKLKLNESWYQCKFCTRISIKAIRDKCPHCGEQCDSTDLLNPSNSQYLRARKSFYRDPVIKFLEPDSTIFNLCVEEHTAQLSYRDEDTHQSTNDFSERRFKDLLISDEETPVDILSCTTTMEVGVDIGSLISVSMRNVPPARQNYQQRAGRAGRRGAALSTVVTFAQTGSHDSYYFENPDEIISGKPINPDIDINNLRLIGRHVYATIIQAFFHRSEVKIEIDDNDLMKVLGTTKDFYQGDSDFTIHKLQEWLHNGFELDGIRQSIENWIPDGVKSDFDLTEYSKKLINILEENKPEDFGDLNSYDEKLLDFLFDCDLLPSYAFPRHMCSFPIQSLSGGKFSKIITEEMPQQSLATALTEYAPGRLVVIKKKTYKVGTVAGTNDPSLRDRAAILFKKIKKYTQCPNCSYMEVHDPELSNSRGCIHCGFDYLETLEMIQPEIVYADGGKEIDEFNDDDEYTSATSAQLPYVKNMLPDSWELFRRDIYVAAETNQELVTINKGDLSSDDSTSGFYVCTKCGKSKLNKNDISKNHKRDYLVRGVPADEICKGEFKKVNLGYSFNSDVFIMRVPLHFPLIQSATSIDRDCMNSAGETLAEAFLQASSRMLEVDPKELNCGIRFLKIDKINYLDIFIYDTASGGAGYSGLLKQIKSSIFLQAKNLLDINQKNCCDSSCYRCLQNYSNRRIHTKLDKRFGMMLWNYIDSGNTPEFYTGDEQLKIAAELVTLLELDGWKLDTSNHKGIKFNKSEKLLSFVIYPGILNQSNLIDLIPGFDFYISDYEVIKSLPSAYAKVSLK
jgi:Lhr-like helicase